MDKENEIRLPTDEEMQEWRRLEKFIIDTTNLVSELYESADKARLKGLDPVPYEKLASAFVDAIKIIDDDATRMRRDIQKRLDDWRNAPYIKKLDEQ